MSTLKAIIMLLGSMLLAVGCASSPQGGKLSGNTFNYSPFAKPMVKGLKFDSPTSILFVGNSYLYYGDSVHNHVRRMVEAAGLKTSLGLTYKSATIGGAAIYDHNIDHLLNPENLRVDKPFEVVILQGGSAGPLSAKRRELFSQTVSDFSKKIGQSGGATVLYMTHAYVEPHRLYREGMIEDIASLYIETGNEVGALVIPVGLAFEEAYSRNPDMKLHKSFDGSHPDIAGTYLAAATVFASLYSVSPVGNEYDYYGAIDPKTKLFLQTVAQDTVAQFYDRN